MQITSYPNILLSNPPNPNLMILDQKILPSYLTRKYMVKKNAKQSAFNGRKKKGLNSLDLPIWVLLGHSAISVAHCINNRGHETRAAILGKF